MALKATLESLDGVSDEIKAHYVEGDGKFTLGVDPVDGVELTTGGLTSALSKERETVRSLKDQVAKFGDLDVQKARDALTKVEEMANWKPEDKIQEQIDSVKKQLVEQHSQETAERDATIESLTSNVEELLVEAQVKAALKEHEGFDLMVPHVKAKTRMRQDEKGTFVVEVLGADGNPRLGGDGKTLSISALVEEMKKDPQYAPGFKGVDSSGGGVPPGGPSGPGGGSAHTISGADAKDVGKYRAAKAAAEKAGQQLQVLET